MRLDTPHLKQPRANFNELRIGQNSHAQWVVQDIDRRRGGLFVNREEALRYAFAESADIGAPVIMVPNGIELDW